MYGLAKKRIKSFVGKDKCERKKEMKEGNARESREKKFHYFQNQCQAKLNNYI